MNSINFNAQQTKSQQEESFAGVYLSGQNILKKQTFDENNEAGA